MYNFEGGSWLITTTGHVMKIIDNVRTLIDTLSYD